LFWPLPHHTPGAVTPVDMEWEPDKIKRSWAAACLDRQTGQLRQASTPGPTEIPGWLYRVAGERGATEPALPTKCPRCDANYARRRTFKTPLRNHRTGFQKATQVLASALFREMREATPGQNTRKLVIFSDSRQDAAKLAAGMERDHFRDILRLALLQAFWRYWDDLVAFLRVNLANNTGALGMLLQLNPDLQARVAEPPGPGDMTARARFTAAYADNPHLLTEALMWAQNLPPVNQQARTEWLALLEGYPGPVPINSLRGITRDRLLSLGLCPGGSSY